ncbi:unnamed protein product [Rotaria socialis]|uniref:Uncharacterized protein n=2 Tax=Rotaria socialis TaxID=392032 RepID=A0A817TSF6_9BILA|nr:unnamed protein product [Rotaria socialis]CAF3709660.1 unnamed protein product [Rotaria socialis]
MDESILSVRSYRVDRRKGAIVRYGNEDPNRVISIEELEINELTETSKNPDGSTVEKTTTRKNTETRTCL